eukprot:865902-Prorocentrum_minimum.AAC.1
MMARSPTSVRFNALNPLEARLDLELPEEMGSEDGQLCRMEVKLAVRWTKRTERGRTKEFTFDTYQ